MEIFLLKKNDDNNFVLQLFVFGQRNTRQISLDLESDKRFFKKKLKKKRIVYIVRIKTRLNLIR